MTIRGSCLCGRVAFENNGKVSDIGQCHCSKCRKSTGAAHATTLVTAKDSFRWSSGETSIKTYETATGYNSAFCAECGSPAPKFRNGKVFMVPASGGSSLMLNQPSGHPLTDRASRPAYRDAVVYLKMECTDELAVVHRRLVEAWAEPTVDCSATGLNIAGHEQHPKTECSVPLARPAARLV